MPLFSDVTSTFAYKKEQIHRIKKKNYDYTKNSYKISSLCVDNFFLI